MGDGDGKLATRGQTALITGGSSGIGAAFADALAERGMDLILVARSEFGLNTVAEGVRQRHGVKAQVISRDLSEPEAPFQLADEILSGGAHVDLLVNNAGFATYGRLHSADARRLAAQIQLNVAALVLTTRAFLPEMLDRGHGGVINVASTAAFQPVPYMAVYSATKSFVLNFSESLWAEARGTAVRIQALCPGATDTPFFDVVGAEEASVGKRMRPEDVVAASLRGLDRNRGVVVPGGPNRMLAQLSRVLPRRIVARISEKTMRPRA